MCGRCLSEGRFLHTDKAATSGDDDGTYELKIYPGYCSLNPVYAAQQLVVKKKKRKPASDPSSQEKQPTLLQPQSASAAAPDNTPQSDPLHHENKASSQEEDHEKNQDGTVDHLISIKRTEASSTQTVGSSSDNVPVTKTRFLFHDLHVLVLNERLRSHQNKIIQWVHSVIEGETVVRIASLDASQHTSWNTSTIIDSIQQFTNEVCTETTTVECDRGLEDAVNKEESALAVTFVSVSSDLKPTYNAQFFRLFKQNPASKDNSLGLKSAYMVDPPTTSLACCLLLRAVYRRFQRWSGTARCGDPTSATTKRIASSQSAASSIILIIYHQDTDDYLDSSSWLICTINAGIHWILQTVGFSGLPSFLYCEETLAYLSQLYQ